MQNIPKFQQEFSDFFLIYIIANIGNIFVVLIMIVRSSFTLFIAQHGRGRIAFNYDMQLIMHFGLI